MSRCFFFFQAEDGIRDLTVRSSDVCSSDLAEVLPSRAEDPDAFGAGDPDGAALVALHPVDEIALLETPCADALGERAPVRDGAIGADVEDADVRSRRVVDIEQRLVR